MGPYTHRDVRRWTQRRQSRLLYDAHLSAALATHEGRGTLKGESRPVDYGIDGGDTHVSDLRLSLAVPEPLLDHRGRGLQVVWRQSSLRRLRPSPFESRCGLEERPAVVHQGGRRSVAQPRLLRLPRL